MKKRNLGIIALLAVIAISGTFWFLNSRVKQIKHDPLSVSAYSYLDYEVLEEYTKTPVDDAQITLKVKDDFISLPNYLETIKAPEKSRVIPITQNTTIKVTNSNKEHLFDVKVQPEEIHLFVMKNGVTLDDNEEVNIANSESAYQEITSRAYVKRFDEEVEIEVEVEGSVDVDAEGSYPLKFIASSNGQLKTLAITVTVTVEVEEVPEVEKPIGQISDPSAETVLVNRTRALPRNYVPPLACVPNDYAVGDCYEATPNTVNAFVAMVDAMQRETGLWMYVTSSYRDYDFQNQLYTNYVNQHGQYEADRMSARPGTSEHQTGLVIDVVTPGGNMFAFKETEQSTWVNQNAHRFGFIVRYQEGKEGITGYMPEAWHLRYIGDIAPRVYNSGLTYDEWYALNLN